MAEKIEDDKKVNPIKAGNSDNLVLDLYFGKAEKTEQRSPYVSDTYTAPYNSDDVYQKTGDYSIYEEMKNDDQVNVALSLKKDLVLGSGWDMETEKDGDTELADSLYSRLNEDPEVALEDMLDDFIDKEYGFGFGIAEKRFALRPDKSLTLRSLKTRHPNSWLLHTDVHGNITKYEQHGSKSSIPVNPKSLMYGTVGNSTVGPYGKSDLRAAHDAWFVKRHITRFYSIFLEKNASAIPVARYDKNLPDDRVAQLANIIKSFQTKTSLTIPKEIDIEFLESKGQGDPYIKGINLFNMFIGRALFVPDLLGFTGEGSSQGGSQALGREQVEIFMKHIGRRRRSLERLVNRHLVQPMVVYNDGFQENYPKFKLKPISDDKAIEYAKTFSEAMRGNMYKPSEDEINHFRSLIDFPEGDVEFKAPEPKWGAGKAGSTNPPRPGQLDPSKDDGNPEDEDELNDEKKDFAFKKPEGEFHKKTDFTAIEAQLDASEQTMVKELRPVIEEIYEDLYEQMRKKKIVNGLNSKPERIKTIKLKHLAKFQKIMKKHFKAGYENQGSIARAELFKQEFAQALPPETYLAWLEDETFQYVGDWEYRVTQESAVEMRNAIRDGRPISSVVDIIDDSGKRASAVSVERYSRTKFTEIANMARVNAFKEAKVVQGYQFSAVLDSRTTTICAGLHGKKFTELNAPIPPLHFNCRSILIPITIFEDFEADTKPNKEMETTIRGKRQMIPVQDSSKSLPEFIKIHGGKGFVDKSGVKK